MHSPLHGINLWNPKNRKELGPNWEDHTHTIRGKIQKTKEQNGIKKWGRTSGIQKPHKQGVLLKNIKALNSLEGACFNVAVVCRSFRQHQKQVACDVIFRILTSSKFKYLMTQPSYFSHRMMLLVGRDVEQGFQQTSVELSSLSKLPDTGQQWTHIKTKGWDPFSQTFPHQNNKTDEKLIGLAGKSERVCEDICFFSLESRFPSPSFYSSFKNNAKMAF